MEKEKYNLPASKLNIEPEELPEKDFRESFHWRIFRIIAEFVEGWEFLANLKKSVTFLARPLLKKTTNGIRKLKNLDTS